MPRMVRLPRSRRCSSWRITGNCLAWSNGHLSFVPTVSRPGPREATVVRLRQVVRDQPVFQAGLLLHITPQGEVSRLTGQVLPDHALPDQGATLSAEEAAEFVRGTPEGAELGWFAPDFFGRELDEVRPAWRVRVLGDDEEDVYVDAVTGAELFRQPLTEHDRHVEVFQCVDCLAAALPGSLQHDDQCHGAGDSTCPPGNCSGGVCQAPPPLPGSSPLVLDNTLATYDYFSDRHGRDSWDDGQCGQPGHPCTNAALHRMRAVADTGCGPCTGFWRSFSLATAPALVWLDDQRGCIDIVAHEFTHGVDQSEGDIFSNPCTQSRALNEGIPDVFGELVEGHLSGTPADWWHGTGCRATVGCSSRNSKLFDPPAFFYTCSGACGGDNSIQPQPDTWNNYRPECDGHFNSTLVGKVGFLMGRPAAAGAANHGGLNVTGLGEAVAGQVWYDALTTGLTGNATFGQLRTALLAACWDNASLNYINCVMAVDAVGIWSGDYDQDFATDAPVALGTWAVNGTTRRFIFYKEAGGTNLYVRDRTCVVAGSCSWSSPLEIETTSAGPSVAVLPGNALVMCFRSTGGTLWCDRILADGSLVIGPDVNVTIEGEPSLVQLNGDLYIAYRKWNNELYWRRYQAGVGWGAENAMGFSSAYPPVLASSDEDFYGNAATNALWLVYLPLGGVRVAYRKLDLATNTWGAEQLAGQADQSPGMAARATAMVFRQRFHIAVEDGANKVGYLSCGGACAGQSNDWTRFVVQDGTGSGLTLDNHGAYSGNSFMFRRLVGSNDLMVRVRRSH